MRRNRRNEKEIVASLEHQKQTIKEVAALARKECEEEQVQQSEAKKRSGLGGVKLGRERPGAIAQ